MSDNEALPVTEEDRWAAFHFLKANEKFWIDRGCKITKGEADNDPLVQTFARHAASARKEEQEQFKAALLLIASQFYALGSAESRGIITAIEHYSAIRALPPVQGEPK